MATPFDAEGRIRLDLQQIEARAVREYDAHLVNGFDRPIGEATHCESQRYPIASFKNTIRAWRVSHEGGRSFRWLSFPVPEKPSVPFCVVVIPMGTGYGVPFPEPSGYFKLLVNGREAVDFTESKYSTRWEKGPYVFYYRVFRSQTAPEGLALNLDPYITESRMASSGLGYLLIPSELVQPSRPLELEIRTVEYFPSRTWVRIDEVNFPERLANNWYLLNWEKGLEELMRPRVPEVGDCHAYFGDIHAHSYCGRTYPCVIAGTTKRCVDCTLTGEPGGNGCGYGTIKNNYLYARHAAALDFFCLTDHDFQMSEEDWRLHLEIARAFTEDSRFVAINGYEYTSWWFGHRNVYFRDDDPVMPAPAVPFGAIYGRHRERPPEEMFRCYVDKKVDFISIPHHPTSAEHPYCWDRWSAAHEPMVEVFSGWGSSEADDAPLMGRGASKIGALSIGEALKRGVRVGFVAGSDSHDGCPGHAQGSGLFNWANKFSEVGSGHTVVLCERLTREELYDALKSRSAYATTGARILADFRVNGLRMGQEGSASRGREVRLDVRAPAPIERIHIIKNGRVLLRELCDEKAETFVVANDPPELEVDTYYARVTLRDREMAWISPIWVRR